MLQAGAKGTASEKVCEKNTAAALGSGLLAVYATPAMIALMECASHTSVAPFLEPGQGTVGTSMSIKHTSATPMGMTVTAESELIEVDHRRLVFKITARDDAGEIGSGTHERFIIDSAKFMEKAQAKGAH